MGFIRGARVWGGKLVKANVGRGGNEGQAELLVEEDSDFMVETEGMRKVESDERIKLS